MTWAVTAAIAGSAVLGAVTSADASRRQANAAKDAAALSNSQYQQNRNDLAPWRQSGVAANNRLMDLLGLSTPQSRLGDLSAPTREQFTTAPQTGAFLGMRGDRGGGQSMYGPSTPGRFDQAGYDAAMANYNSKLGATTQPPPGYGSLLKTFSPADLTNDPGYQFELTQGEKSLNRAAASRGMYFAPATSQALSQFNTDYAGTKYNEAFNRDQAAKGQIYNFLSGTSGAGENAAGQTAGLGANAAANAGNYLTQGANASAAGEVGAANAITGGVGSYVNYANQSRLLDLLNQNRAPTTNYYPGGGGA